MISKNKIITIVPIVLFFIFINLFFIKSIQSNDLWFHLRIGQETLENHSISQFDTHSFTANKVQYVNQSWLAQVILFLIFKNFSFTGLQIFHSLVLISSLLLLFFSVSKSELKVSIFAIFFSLLLIIPSDEIRPFLFTWLLLSLLIFSIQKKYIWVLPLIFLLWPNLHAGFLIGLPVAFFYLLKISLDTKKKYPLIIFAISLLATFINPNGINLYLYPLSLGATNALLGITEWQPFEPNTSFFWFYFVFVAFTIGLSIKNKLYKTNFLEFIFILVVCFLGYLSRRHNIIAFICLYPLFVNFISKIIPKKQEFLPLISFLGLIIVFFSFKTFQIITSKRGLAIDRVTFPVYGLEFIKNNNIYSNTFNDYDFGGFLMLYQPEKKIFIDSRVEIYQGQPAKDYLTMASASTGWENVIDKYNIDCIFIRHGPKINQNLIKNPQWGLVYFDDNSVIYLKKGTYPSIPRLKYINPYAPGPIEEIDSSIKEYQYLIKINPNFFNGYRFIAYCYLLKRDFPAAKDYFVQYLSINPENIINPEILQVKTLLNIQ